MSVQWNYIKAVLCDSDIFELSWREVDSGVVEFGLHSNQKELPSNVIDVGDILGMELSHEYYFGCKVREFHCFVSDQGLDVGDVGGDSSD